MARDDPTFARTPRFLALNGRAFVPPPSAQQALPGPRARREPRGKWVIREQAARPPLSTVGPTLGFSSLSPARGRDKTSSRTAMPRLFLSRPGRGAESRRSSPFRCPNSLRLFLLTRVFPPSLQVRGALKGQRAHRGRWDLRARVGGGSRAGVGAFGMRLGSKRGVT